MTSGLTCVSDIVVESSGPVIIRGNGSAPILDLTGCRRFTLRGDFTFIGDAPDYAGAAAKTSGVPADSVFTRVPRIGIRLDRSENIAIEGRIAISNVAGDCLQARNTPAWQSVVRVRGLSVSHCQRGIHLYEGAEYMTISDFNAFNNVYGIVVGSGNNTFSNGKAIYNTVAIHLTGGANNAHGIFTAVEANHNEYNLLAVDVTLGQTFIGCHFIADQAGAGHGRIELFRSRAINLVGGQIGSDIRIDAGSQLSLQSNYIRTDIARLPVIAAGGMLIARDNFAAAGLWVGNN